MAVAREEKAQHETRAARHQHQNAEKEAAATASVLGKHGAILLVAALVATVRGAIVGCCEARIVATTRPSRANGHRGRFQVEARECTGRGRDKGWLRNQRTALFGCCAVSKGPPKRRLLRRRGWHRNRQPKE